jgi:DNA-directed RNA polymerase specialized sigma24 family protein
MKTSDETAIEKTLAGDQSAFAGIVSRHQLEVMRLCLFVTGEFDTANNLVKRSFLSFANNMVSYRNAGDVHPLLIDHAAGELLAWIRRGAQTVSPAGSDSEKLAKAFFFPAEEMKRLQNTTLEQIRDYSIRVSSAMSSLPPMQKLVAGLSFFEGRKYLNISVLTSLSHDEVAGLIAQFRKSVLGG